MMLRISAIAAISTSGYVGVELTYGTVNGDVFTDFVRGTLIPEMEPFDGEIKKSVVIMDNCSIHHVEEVKTLLDEAGILLFFLPPYSPDYNPIENAFSAVKSYLKDHDELLQSINDPLPVIKSAFINCLTETNCQHWITHCKYNT